MIDNVCLRFVFKEVESIYHFETQLTMAARLFGRALPMTMPLWTLTRLKLADNWSVIADNKIETQSALKYEYIYLLESHTYLTMHVTHKSQL